MRAIGGSGVAPMASEPSDDDDYTNEEVERRMNAALKRALNTPHKPSIVLPCRGRVAGTRN